MPTDPRKRQKKLERRSARRKEKKHVQAREASAGLASQLSAAARFPVLHCWVGKGLDDQGLGWVLLSRQMPGGEVAVAVFLVDRYCLGVKDTHGEVLGRFSYDQKYTQKMNSQMQPRAVSPADARKLLEGAVAYAESIGLPPPPGYAKLMPLFGDVKASDSSMEFEFGKDGKPLFINGPRDTPERCRQIMAILTKTCGPPGEGFHFLIGGPAPTEIEPLEEGEDEEGWEPE